MAKYDREQLTKIERNSLYAMKYRQRKCKDCGHRSSKPQRCALCKGEMKP